MRGDKIDCRLSCFDGGKNVPKIGPTQNKSDFQSRGTVEAFLNQHVSMKTSDIKLATSCETFQPLRSQY